MYEVKAYKQNGVKEETQVSFRVAYSDWLELEQSKEWMDFRKCLERVQMKKEVLEAKECAIPFVEEIIKGKKGMSEEILGVVRHFNDLRKKAKEKNAPMDFTIAKKEDAPELTNNFCQLGAPNRINRMLIEYDPDYESFLVMIFPSE